MTIPEINALLALCGLTITQIAKDIDEDRSAVSQTINQLRDNEKTRQIRLKVARRLGQAVEQRVSEWAA